MNQLEEVETRIRYHNSLNVIIKDIDKGNFFSCVFKNLRYEKKKLFKRKFAFLISLSVFSLNRKSLPKIVPIFFTLDENDREIPLSIA